MRYNQSKFDTILRIFKMIFFFIKTSYYGKIVSQYYNIKHQKNFRSDVLYDIIIINKQYV